MGVGGMRRAHLFAPPPFRHGSGSPGSTVTMGGHQGLFLMPAEEPWRTSAGGGVWGEDRLLRLGGTSVETSMCSIEQMLLVQYGISFRFIFALGLTHFLFRILKKSLLWCSDEKYICCLHIISIKYEDMFNAGAVCLSL